MESGWSVLSNSRFNALDKLVAEVHSVRMSVGAGRSIKSKGRHLSVKDHLRWSVVEVKAENTCLTHYIVNCDS